MKRAWLAFAVILGAGGSAGAGDEPPPPSFSQAAPAKCGAGGIEVGVALVYQLNTVGPIAGTYVELGFGSPLGLPDAPKDLRARVTSTLPGGAKLGSVARDAKHVRVAVTTTDQGIPPTKLFRVRFDCGAGSQIRASDLPCATEQVVAASGQPMDAALADEVRCLVIDLDPVRN